MSVMGLPLSCRLLSVGVVARTPRIRVGGVGAARVMPFLAGARPVEGSGGHDVGFGTHDLPGGILARGHPARVVPVALPARPRGATGRCLSWDSPFHVG